jgi:hypothetical protein
MSNKYLDGDNKYRDVTNLILEPELVSIPAGVVVDPKTWTLLGGSNVGMKKVVTNGKIFIGLSEGGGIHSSTDGRTWTSTATGHGANSGNVLAVNDKGVFALLGNGRLSTSSDGITWNTRNISYSNMSFDFMVFVSVPSSGPGSGQSLFVAVSNSGYYSFTDSSPDISNPASQPVSMQLRNTLLSDGRGNLLLLGTERILIIDYRSSGSSSFGTPYTLSGSSWIDNASASNWKDGAYDPINDRFIIIGQGSSAPRIITVPVTGSGNTLRNISSWYATVPMIGSVSMPSMDHIIYADGYYVCVSATGSEIWVAEAISHAPLLEWERFILTDSNPVSWKNIIYHDQYKQFMVFRQSGNNLLMTSGTKEVFEDIPIKDAIQQLWNKVM